MAKLIRLNEQNPRREEIKRAIRAYEKRKESLCKLIEHLRAQKAYKSEDNRKKGGTHD